MNSDLDYIQNTSRGTWSEQQIDYLLSNTGYFPVNDMASFIGKQANATRDKIAELGLDPTCHGLPDALDDLQCIPNGMSIFNCTSGRIFRVPSSTPGIVSRTIHISRDDTDEPDEKDRHAS